MSQFMSKPPETLTIHSPFSSTTPIHFILLHFIVTVTLFNSGSPVSSSPPRLPPHLLSNSLFMSSSLQIRPSAETASRLR